MRFISKLPALAYVGLLVAVGLGCAERDPVGLENAEQELVSALPAFSASLVDPSSLGLRHNEQLDSILARVREYRAVKPGRSKITKAEYCDILHQFSLDRMAEGSVPVQWHKREPRHGKAFALSCAMPRVPVEDKLASLMSGEELVTPVDWIDSVLLEEWDGSDFELPTVYDDSVMIGDATTHVLGAMQTAISATDMETVVANAVASYPVYDEEATYFVGEVGGLAVNSTHYWDENLEAWQEEFCTEEEPANFLSPASDPEECDMIENIRTGFEPQIAAVMDDFWENVREFAEGDVDSMIAVGAAAVMVYRGVRGRYEDAGRDLAKAGRTFREELKDKVTAIVGSAKDPKVVRKVAGQMARKSGVQFAAAAVAIDSGIGMIAN